MGKLVSYGSLSSLFFLLIEFSLLMWFCQTCFWCPWRLEGGIGSRETEVTNDGCWESNLGALQERRMLLIDDLSFQPLTCLFFFFLKISLFNYLWVFVVVVYLVFFETGFLCVALVAFKLTDLSASTSWVLELKMCTTTTRP